MVLVITSSFPRDEEDIAGHFVAKWAGSIRPEGATWALYCWRGAGAVSREVEPGMEVEVVPYGPRKMERLFYGAGAPENLEEAPWRAMMALPALGAMMAAVARGIRRRSPSVLVGHWLLPGGWIARVMGQLFGIPSYVVGHSGGVQMLSRMPGPVATRIARQVVESGPVTVPTEALKEELGRWCDTATVQVAPMGYEPAPMQHVERRKRCLGFLGRLVPIKGLGVVLEAVERLRREGVELELEVVGDGPCRQEWEAKAGKGVRFLGAQFGRDKWERLRSWRGGVVPSQVGPRGRHEGLPVTVLEAASVGTVPLVGAVPGVEKWLARGGVQRVKRQGDPVAWARAMEWLLGLGDEEVEGLRREGQERVEGLAWPIYAEWWRRWLRT